jgi:hypothetical protein
MQPAPGLTWWFAAIRVLNQHLDKRQPVMTGLQQVWECRKDRQGKAQVVRPKWALGQHKHASSDTS